MSYLDGGAYEFGTAESASFMTDLLNGSFLRAPTDTNVPGYGSWDTQKLPLPQQTPFSPSIGNAGIIFDFNASKRNIHPNLPSSGPVGTAPYLTSVECQGPKGTAMGYVPVGRLCWQPRHSFAGLLWSSPTSPTPRCCSTEAFWERISFLRMSLLPVSRLPIRSSRSSLAVRRSWNRHLTPYPQFGGFFPVNEMDGTAFYNALQVQGEKRFAGGLAYLANLTVARDSMQYSGRIGAVFWNGINAYNPGWNGRLLVARPDVFA